MGDSSLKRLKDRLAWLESEKTRLDAQIQAYRAVIADQEQDDAPKSLAGSPAKLLVNHMWRILEEAARPLHYREIYQRLVDRGVSIPGQDPVKNVGAHLSADHRFEKLGKGVWALRSWRETNAPGKPLPDAIKNALGWSDPLAHGVSQDSTSGADEVNLLSPNSVAAPIQIAPHQFSRRNILGKLSRDEEDALLVERALMQSPDIDRAHA